ncbi:MAG: peptide deformylase [Deltaproteobacteria bacterium]|nr:MAG: peptide deformylase [Deltaproteobacteria bacterium]
MAVLPIRVFPDPVLKEKAAPVEGVTAEVSAFIDDLLETMRQSPGGVGIAAPQVGMLSRIVIVDVSGHRRGSQEQNHGLLVLVNPEILAMGGKQVVREGCMSLPDYTANVQRAQWVLVDSLDRNGNRRIVESLGFEAVAIQHEMDHLDGILFIDRVVSIKNDLFRRKKYR